ncbi:Pre-rRNA-processing protein TSR2-domain-containing protein [Cristinia sonorae]|uniref:Pre-rRNA-processing protein TSR2-domain-containing protein n=1 Tax=Cristinia sonorae TaxID=1940300 RepID=A0A8K0XTY9_9AGAR|nr:Pre-rRNA-processing protein TSR2-domain-containing protein [Cristinia sonorae]
MSTSSSVDTAQPAAPPPSTSVLFARGVIACLAIWPALRVAVDQNWGGPSSASKRTWLASVIVDAFEEQTDPSPDVPYVELILLQVMEDEFDTMLEDGSAEDVARNIVELWRASQGGDVQAVLTLEERAERLKGKNVQIEERAGDNSDWEDESDEDGSGEDEDEEAPTLIDTSTKPSRQEPEVDEDGFTMVKGKGKRR